MWTPKQLLKDEVIITLRQAGFSAMQIEFLGWLSYVSNTLNNSTNPAKAAHTMLSKATIEKMVDRFFVKKRETVSPPDPAIHDAVDRKFAKFEQWVERVEAEATPYEPSDQDRLDAQAD